ncbi:MAG: CoA ester lyase [Pirellulales bacterium]|nr:CoA ester lyase [Pirellulales bacterium]
MLLRSLLFTPGNNLRRIVKSGTLGADAVILDLEDSVPAADKETARLFVRDSIAEVGRSGAAVFVRINALATGLAEDDLDWAVQPGLRGIMLPKPESPDHVTALVEQLKKREESPLSIIPLVETAKGIINAYAIASASPRVIAVALGGLDYIRDMGVRLTPEGTELSYARAHLGVAARAAGVLAFDTPCIEVKNRELLDAESRSARQLGFRGKLLIHPSQIGPVNEVFSPGAEEVSAARRIVETFEQARRQGQGAITLDGRMIDEANYRQARELLAAAEGIKSEGDEKPLAASPRFYNSPLLPGEGQGVRALLPKSGPHPNPLPKGEGTKQ